MQGFVNNGRRLSCLCASLSLLPRSWRGGRSMLFQLFSKAGNAMRQEVVFSAYEGVCVCVCVHVGCRGGWGWGDWGKSWIKNKNWPTRGTFVIASLTVFLCRVFLQHWRAPGTPLFSNLPPLCRWSIPLIFKYLTILHHFCLLSDFFPGGSDWYLMEIANFTCPQIPDFSF